MTDLELAAVVRGIVPLMRECVTKALADASTKIAVLEAQLKAIGDVRDKVVTLEAKAAAPTPQPEPVTVDFAPVLERVAAAEARLAAIGDLRDRVMAMELKAPPDLTGLDKRADVVEGRLRFLEDSAIKELSGIRERLAVVETRSPVPGPAGTDGQPGRDGMDGKDGADGLGFDDLSVDFDGDRTILLTFARGTQKKAFPIQLPYLKYQALYEDGRTYVKGDVVTWGGHMWHCEVADSINKKPGESKDWLQCVQRGREGKAGRDGRDVVPLPVLTAGGGK